MNRIRHAALGVIAIVSLAGSAHGIEVEVPADASTVVNFNVTATIDGTALSDSASSALTGSITIDLDAVPVTGISIVDLDGTLTDELVFNLTVPFLGGATLTIPAGAVASYGDTMPTGPVPVDMAGGFNFPSVLVNLDGSADVVGTGALGGLVTDQTIQLSDFNPFMSPAIGTVTVANDIVTLDVSVGFDGVSDLGDGIMANVTGSLEFSGSAPLPEESCPCEFGGSAETVDVLDLLAFLDLWFASDPGADFNGTAPVDVLDLLEFLSCWFSATGGTCE